MKRLSIDISREAFSKALINKGKLVVARDVLRKNAHKLLDKWLDKPAPEVGEKITFTVVEDRGYPFSR